MQATLKTGQFDAKLDQQYKERIDQIENNMLQSLLQGLNLKRKGQDKDETPEKPEEPEYKKIFYEKYQSINVNQEKKVVLKEK